MSHHAPWLRDAPKRLALFEAHRSGVTAPLSQPERSGYTLREPHGGDEGMLLISR